jgi:hypothetical protein
MDKILQDLDISCSICSPACNPPPCSPCRSAPLTPPTGVPVVSSPIVQPKAQSVLHGIFAARASASNNCDEDEAADLFGDFSEDDSSAVFASDSASTTPALFPLASSSACHFPTPLSQPTLTDVSPFLAPVCQPKPKKRLRFKQHIS